MLVCVFIIVNVHIKKIFCYQTVYNTFTNCVHIIYQTILKNIPSATADLKKNHLFFYFILVNHRKAEQVQFCYILTFSLHTQMQSAKYKKECGGKLHAMRFYCSIVLSSS